MRRFLAACFLLMLSLPAFAQSNVTVNYRANTSTITQVSPTNPLPVTGGLGGLGNVGGYDSGSSPIQTATPANSSHAAGVSIGGLFSIPIARTNGGSGIATTLYWTSTGGAVTQLLVRLWDKNPTNTTCTDNTAFAESATDDQHLLITPFTMTPAAPVNTTGDTNTYITVAGLTLSFKNQDAVATKNVYACVLTTSTDTADENKAVYINLTGVQD